VINANHVKKTSSFFYRPSWLKTHKDDISCTAIVFREADKYWKPKRTNDKDNDRYIIRKVINDDGQENKIKYKQIGKPTIMKHINDNIINYYDNKFCYQTIIYKYDNKLDIKYGYLSTNYIKLMFILECYSYKYEAQSSNYPIW